MRQIVGGWSLWFGVAALCGSCRVTAPAVALDPLAGLPFDPVDEDVRSDLDDARWIALACDLAGRGDHEGAVGLLDDALELRPDSALLFEVRGGLLEELGFLWAAERDLDRSAALDPARGRVWVALGRVRLALGLASGAEECFHRAVALGEEGSALHLLVARTHVEHGERPSALAEYERAVGALADPPVELLIEAAACVALSPGSVPAEHAQALAWIDRALTRAPEHPRGTLVRGLLLEAAGEELSALSYYLQVLGTTPFPSGQWSDLARLARSRERTVLRRAVARAAELAEQAGDLSRRTALSALLPSEPE